MVCKMGIWFPSSQPSPFPSWHHQRVIDCLILHLTRNPPNLASTCWHGVQRVLCVSPAGVPRAEVASQESLSLLPGLRAGVVPFISPTQLEKSN